MGLFSEKTAWEEVCSEICAREWFFRFRKNDEESFLAWLENHRKIVCPGPKATYPKCGGRYEIVVRPWTDRDRFIAARYRGVGFGYCNPGLHTTLPSQAGVEFGWFTHEQREQSKPPAILCDGALNSEFSP